MKAVVCIVMVVGLNYVLSDNLELQKKLEDIVELEEMSKIMAGNKKTEGEKPIEAAKTSAVSPPEDVYKYAVVNNKYGDSTTSKSQTEMESYGENITDLGYGNTEGRLSDNKGSGTGRDKNMASDKASLLREIKYKYGRRSEMNITDTTTPKSGQDDMNEMYMGYGNTEGKRTGKEGKDKNRESSKTTQTAVPPSSTKLVKEILSKWKEVLSDPTPEQTTTTDSKPMNMEMRKLEETLLKLMKSTSR